MKKSNLISFMTVLICTFFLSISAYADDSDVVVSLQINNPIMEINGVESEIDPGRGTMPTIINGRTLIPIRAIIEAFSGTVAWNESTRTVTLSMEDDTIDLIIDSPVAYVNGNVYNLDVSPTVINERTMLPIRFISESFNLGVAWEDSTKTVTVIRNSFDTSEYEYLVSILPEYSGTPYVVLNNNVPYFKEYEIISGSFEYYSKLDEIGRCDVCMASLDDDLMPTEDRQSISSVKPTGWINVAYENIDGGYLYNRCHLIGFQLTGENANERNLITGTRYMNVDGMLPFENMVSDYVKETDNSVMYRVTPVFDGDNLVARGVLMEAYSVEDNGKGISLCVFCYNVQPYIVIDYATGVSSSTYIGNTQQFAGTYVININTNKFHYPDCSSVSKMKEENKEITDKSRDLLIAEGKLPCGNCNP